MFGQAPSEHHHKNFNDDMIDAYFSLGYDTENRSTRFTDIAISFVSFKHKNKFYRKTILTASDSLTESIKQVRVDALKTSDQVDNSVESNIEIDSSHINWQAELQKYRNDINYLDNNRWFLSDIYSRSKLPGEVFDFLTLADQSDIRRLVALNPNNSKKNLEILSKDEVDEVKYSALSNPSINKELVLKFIKSFERSSLENIKNKLQKEIKSNSSIPLHQIIPIFNNHRIDPTTEDVIFRSQDKSLITALIETQVLTETSILKIYDLFKSDKSVIASLFRKQIIPRPIVDEIIKSLYIDDASKDLPDVGINYLCNKFSNLSFSDKDIVLILDSWHECLRAKNVIYTPENEIVLAIASRKKSLSEFHQGLINIMYPFGENKNVLNLQFDQEVTSFKDNTEYFYKINQLSSNISILENLKELFDKLVNLNYSENPKLNPLFWFSQRFNERPKNKDIKRKIYKKCQLRAEEISALQEDTWSFPIERGSKEYISEQNNLDREMAIAQYANFLVQSDVDLNLSQKNFVKYFFTFDNSSFGQWGQFKSILKKLEQRTDLTELLALGYLSLPTNPNWLKTNYGYYWREFSRGDLMRMYLGKESENTSQKTVRYMARRSIRFGKKLLLKDSDRFCELAKFLLINSKLDLRSIENDITYTRNWLVSFILFGNPTSFNGGRIKNFILPNSTELSHFDKLVNKFWINEKRFSVVLDIFNESNNAFIFLWCQSIARQLGKEQVFQLGIHQVESALCSGDPVLIKKSIQVVMSDLSIFAGLSDDAKINFYLNSTDLEVKYLIDILNQNFSLSNLQISEIALSQENDTEWSNIQTFLFGTNNQIYKVLPHISYEKIKLISPFMFKSSDDIFQSAYVLIAALSSQSQIKLGNIKLLFESLSTHSRWLVYLNTKDLISDQIRDIMEEYLVVNNSGKQSLIRFINASGVLIQESFQGYSGISSIFPNEKSIIDFLRIYEKTNKSISETDFIDFINTTVINLSVFSVASSEVRFWTKQNISIEEINSLKPTNFDFLKFYDQILLSYPHLLKFIIKQSIESNLYFDIWIERLDSTLDVLSKAEDILEVLWINFERKLDDVNLNYLLNKTEIVDCLMTQYVFHNISKIQESQVEFFLQYCQSNTELVLNNLNALKSMCTSQIISIQNGALTLIRKNNLTSTFWLHLAESGLPLPTEHVHEYLSSLTSSEEVTNSIIQLCDSPVQTARQLGIELIKQIPNKYEARKLWNAMTENPMDDIRLMVSNEIDLFAKDSSTNDNYIELKNVKYFVNSTLLKTRSSRKSKEALKSSINDKSQEVKSTLISTLLRLSRTDEGRDREWAIQQLAQLPNDELQKYDIQAYSTSKGDV
jgi:hypothetical protein